MILRILLLLALLGLAACNKENGETDVSQGTFGLPSTPAVTPVAPLTVEKAAVSQETSAPPIPSIAISVVPLSTEETARKKADEFKAAGKLQDAAIVLRNAGLDKDVFELFAPEDYVFNAKDHPQPSSPEVSETPSVKRHSMMLNGKKVWFTAKAGHTIAYGQKDSSGKKDAKAAMFYVSYTRDDLPPENRPVTFFINGGPNYSSIFLHMAAWGPRRVKIDTPYLPLLKKDFKFSSMDNEETLLDQSDLVFVDAIGTGYSKAIQPHTDGEFRHVTADAEVFRDFVTSYTNGNNRQSSPKYLYGESYGGGRVAFAASLLEAAGTSNYDLDPSSKPAKVLTGVILGSPSLSGDDCGLFGISSCNTIFPVKAMTADYFQEPSKRWSGTRSIDEYAAYIRQFYAQKYTPALKKYREGARDAATLTELQPTLTELQAMFGSPTLAWSNVNYSIELKNRPKANYYGRFDTRMVANDYDTEDFDDTVLGDAVKDLLPTFANYFAKASDYIVYCDRCGWDYPRSTGGVVELGEALAIDPKLKVIAIHGYYDNATPFFKTESQLKQAGLDALIPVKVFNGGHMTYYSEIVRKPIKQALDAFYSPPAVLSAVK